MRHTIVKVNLVIQMWKNQISWWFPAHPLPWRLRNYNEVANAEPGQQLISTGIDADASKKENKKDFAGLFWQQVGSMLQMWDSKCSTDHTVPVW